MLTRIIALLPLFVCRFFGIPVPYARLFPNMAIRHIKGQILLGDSAMPPTSIEGASDDRNKLRNARLATTTWKTWTLFRINFEHVVPVYIMYGDDQVLLTRLRTGNIAVRNGAENCRFAVLDSVGREIGFEIICRGDHADLEKGLRRCLREAGQRVPVEGILDLITFV